MCKWIERTWALILCHDSVFVDGRDRPTILKDMRARIDRNNAGIERAEAIKAMCQIAADRARKLEA
jgi:2-oxo-4-hydroxy-4-carboxy--5-ureidoimidazoline (OHCU) decarboxylase